MAKSQAPPRPDRASPGRPYLYDGPGPTQTTTGLSATELADLGITPLPPQVKKGSRTAQYHTRCIELADLVVDARHAVKRHEDQLRSLEYALGEARKHIEEMEKILHQRTRQANQDAQHFRRALHLLTREQPLMMVDYPAFSDRDRLTLDKVLGRRGE